MRKLVVAGNWKMHGTRAQTTALLQAIKQGVVSLRHVQMVVFPSFVHIPLVESLLAESSIAWGGQNLYLGQTGAFTGEVSGSMLADFACRYVLIGHSERRAVFHEDLLCVAAKFKAALDAGLLPVLCVGETLAQRESGETESVIAAQLNSVIDAVGIAALQSAIIAYEPVWAIGTGLTATPEQAQNVHEFIRQQIAKHDSKRASTMQILYGGSVKADNARGLFAMPDIDGALVGGASLDAASFTAICQAADEVALSK